METSGARKKTNVSRSSLKQIQNFFGPSQVKRISKIGQASSSSSFNSGPGPETNNQIGNCQSQNRCFDPINSTPQPDNSSEMIRKIVENLETDLPIPQLNSNDFENLDIIYPDDLDEINLEDILSVETSEFEVNQNMNSVVEANKRISIDIPMNLVQGEGITTTSNVGIKIFDAARNLLQEKDYELDLFPIFDDGELKIAIERGEQDVVVIPGCAGWILQQIKDGKAVLRFRNTVDLIGAPTTYFQTLQESTNVTARTSEISTQTLVEPELTKKADVRLVMDQFTQTEENTTLISKQTTSKLSGNTHRPLLDTTIDSKKESTKDRHNISNGSSCSSGIEVSPPCCNKREFQNDNNDSSPASSKTIDVSSDESMRPQTSRKTLFSRQARMRPVRPSKRPQKSAAQMSEDELLKYFPPSYPDNNSTTESESDEEVEFKKYINHRKEKW